MLFKMSCIELQSKGSGGWRDPPVAPSSHMTDTGSDEQNGMDQPP